MVLIMSKVNFLKSAAVLVALVSSNLNASFLTSEEIKTANQLAKSSSKFEDFTQSSSEEKAKNPPHWLTVEEYNFPYKEKEQSFCIANSAGPHHGEIALYPGTCIKQFISLTYPGSFNDLPKYSEKYFSCLRYTYISGENSYFILEKVDTGEKYGERGYSQACLKYFLDEFVSKRTQATIVVTDCRASDCRYFFQKYGFQKVIHPQVIYAQGSSPYNWVKGREFKFDATQALKDANGHDNEEDYLSDIVSSDSDDESQ